jgi:hypothetical protein
MENNNKPRPRLAVVTHTRGREPELMSLMMKSLLPALPSYAEHFVIPCPELLDCKDFKVFERMKWEARLLGEHVCFVDDDDLVINDSIRKCMSAFDADPTLGCVFTNQELIDQEGNHLPDLEGMEQDKVYTYQEAAYSAQTIHHLAIVRSDAIDTRAYGVTEALENIGIEWLMKATAALDHRAVHIPMYGYQWRQRNSSMSKSADWMHLYNSKLALLQSYLACRMYPQGEIPQMIVD